MSSLSPDSGHWNDGEQASALYGHDAQSEAQAGYQNLGMLKSFGALQKKTTRDGQPAKRRGPKPDSKPAQTRRQELNRQAQRTHRERKEQYIKALEIEIARLREAFAHEANHADNVAKRNEAMLRENQQEIFILRDMLASRGIPYETELETRKASARMTGRDTGSLSPPHLVAHASPFSAPMTGVPSTVGYSTRPDQARFAQNNSGRSNPGASPMTHHSHSSPGRPDVQEQAYAESPQGVSDLPGIFERDPQLGIDFILALEATCRDHEEYLVRRSASSPNNPEEALFSGHALMATCPPPSHIDNTPAQQGGLEPTYPHQTPQLPTETLNTLLNLSKKMKADGFVEGGQVTPIMALQSLRGHRSYSSLTRDDVVSMIESIRKKVRCYGFGAVMEDFELRDALSTMFATKPETYANLRSDEIDEMYS